MDEKKFNKIVFLERIPIFEDQIETLESFADEVIIPKTNPKNYEEGLNRIRGAEAIVASWFQIKEELIEKNLQLKFIGFWASTMRMDEKLRERIKDKVFLYLTVDYEDNALAEFILGAMICLKNSAFFENQQIREEKKTQFQQFCRAENIENFQDSLLDGKEALILGNTNSSKTLSQVLTKDFKMKATILGCPIKDKPKFYKLLKTSDFVIVNQHHLERPVLKGEEFSTMKDNAILVNTTTGHAIGHKALINKCKACPNFRALMDTHSTYKPDPKMFEIKNIWLTDRRRFMCKEVFRQKTERLIEGFRKYFSN